MCSPDPAQAFETGEACILLWEMVALESNLYGLPLSLTVVGTPGVHLWGTRGIDQPALTARIDQAATAMTRAVLRAPKAGKEAPCPGHRHTTFKLYQARLQQACADVFSFNAAGAGAGGGDGGGGGGAPAGGGGGGGGSGGGGAGGGGLGGGMHQRIVTAHGPMDIAVGMVVACTYNSGSRYYKCTVIKLNRDDTASVLFCDNYSWFGAPFSDFQPWVVPGDIARVIQGRRVQRVRVIEVREDGVVVSPIKKNGGTSAQGEVFVPDIDVQPDRDTPIKLQQAALKAARAQQADATADVYLARPDVVEGVSRTGRRRTALQLRAPAADTTSAPAPRKRVCVRAAASRDSVVADSDSDDAEVEALEAGVGSSSRKRPAPSEVQADSDSDGEVLNYDSDDGPSRDGDESELEPEADRKALPDSVRDMSMADFCFQVVSSFVASLRAYNISAAALCAFPHYFEPCLLHPFHVVLEGRVPRSNLPDADKTTLADAMAAAKDAHNDWCAAAQPQKDAAELHRQAPPPSAWLRDDDILPDVVLAQPVREPPKVRCMLVSVQVYTRHPVSSAVAPRLVSFADFFPGEVAVPAVQGSLYSPASFPPT